MSRHAFRASILIFLLSGTVFAAGSLPDPPTGAERRFEQAFDAIPAAEDHSASAEERHQTLLEQAGARGRIPVIVRLEMRMIPEVALEAAGVQRQRDRLAGIQERVLERLSSTAYRSEAEHGLKRFTLTPALALQVDELDLRELLLDPEVQEIIEDRPVPIALADSVPLIGADAFGAFSGYTGQGQVVAILDTGVDKNHPFLSGKVVSEACYSSNVGSQGASSLCPGGVTESTASDSGLDCDTRISGCGHGTHVAGIAAGDGETFSGVARDAGLIAIQVFSRFDSSTFCGSSNPCVLSYLSDQIKGLERVYDLRNTLVIAAANMSLGGGQFTSACDGEPQKPAIDNLRAVGIATVIASGNNGHTGAISAPACISSAVGVGSTTKQDLVSSFSNSADILDLLAPGSSIQSSVPGDDFGHKWGTSMAAPHAAGAWAVLKEAAPDAGVAELLDDLVTSGEPITDTRSGAGSRIKPRIRLDAALVDDGLPGKPDPITPDGPITTDQPAYTWNAVGGATGYGLYVVDSINDPAIFEAYSAAETGCAAGSGTCSIIPPTTLAFGDAAWWVIARNEAGFGPWSDRRDFTVVDVQPLSNGVSVTGLSGSEDSERFFSIEVPAGASDLEIAISGGTGDADLYVRFGDLSTLSEWDCRPFLNGNNETCTFSSPDTGVYHVMVHGWTAYSGLTLVASYDSGVCSHEEHVILENGTVTSTETHEACRTITAGPGYTVGATGNATFRAGERIILRPGFVVKAGGVFTADIDPGLRP